MLHTAHRLARADAVGIVGVLNNGTVGLGKLLQLASLFPAQGIAEVGDRVAEVIINNRLAVDSSQLVLPSANILYHTWQALSILGQYRNPTGARYRIGAVGEIIL